MRQNVVEARWVGEQEALVATCVEVAPKQQEAAVGDVGTCAY